MKILFTICGRAGSKGIKNKNISGFLGIPLPYYTYAAIELFLDKHRDIDADIAVNTDSRELLKLFDELKNKKICLLERRKEISTDSAPKIAVILDCVERMEVMRKKQYDVVIDLDLTSPLRTVRDIEHLVQKQSETQCDVAFSVTAARRNPWFNMVKKGDKGYGRVISSHFNARQEAPEVFDMNASLYAYKPEYLRLQKGVLDGYSEVITMYDTGILDLDHAEDLELMEVIAEHLYKTKPEFGAIRKYAEAVVKAIGLPEVDT